MYGCQKYIYVGNYVGNYVGYNTFPEAEATLLHLKATILFRIFLAIQHIYANYVVCVSSQRAMV
jgi:hypothetical protein